MEELAYDETLGEGENKYELIGGIKFIMSPAPNLTHGTIINRIMNIFTNYILNNNVKAAVFSDNTDVYFSKEEHYIPDISVICNPEILKSRKRVEGAPDLIVEVLSERTLKNDLGKKKDIYEKYGVKEYWIIDQWSKRIEVYHLIGDRYILDEVYMISDDPEAKTNIKVSIFDDLTIDIHNIFKWWFED
ncbi:MAG: Uma2 family endonuclease [Selenomonadaceae bacterium]|nr:Uma2 family endonuclease [Selenomonadaceae bacterium]